MNKLTNTKYALNLQINCLRKKTNLFARLLDYVAKLFIIIDLVHAQHNTP